MRTNQTQDNHLSLNGLINRIRLWESEDSNKYIIDKQRGSLFKCRATSTRKMMEEI